MNSENQEAGADERYFGTTPFLISQYGVHAFFPYERNDVTIITQPYTHLPGKDY